jgi:hypothetical protein
MPAAKGPMQALRKAALRYPGTEEGVACEGTPVESRTVKARNKAFLFLTIGHARFKLRESLPEATKLAQKKPDQLQVGAGGWVKASLSADGSTPLDVLERWIGESYRLMAAPPTVAAQSRTKNSTAVR